MVDFSRKDCQYDYGKAPWTVNYDLAVKRKLNKETILKIKVLHLMRLSYNNKVSQLEAQHPDIKLYRQLLTDLEYNLQTLWGWALDDRYHPHTRVGV